MSPAEVVALLAVVGALVFVIRPVVAAIAKRIAGEHRGPAMEPAEREEILAELQQVRHEVSELAERMDFAERLLAKPRKDS
jgi:ubiquinone biosynthesis protein UbiJ